MTAHAAILQALFVRERSGQGRTIAVSLFQATADWMNVPYLQHIYGGKTPKRHGLKHPTIAPYGAFPCKDGKQLLISIQNEREWQSLCEVVLGDPSIAVEARFTTNTSRVEHRTDVDALFATSFVTRTREDNISLLKKANVAYGRLSDLDDLAAHPQRQLLSIQTDNGPVELLAPSAIVNGQPQQGGKVPALGADTDRLKAEFS